MLYDQELANKYASSLFDVSLNNESRLSIKSQLDFIYEVLSVDKTLSNLVFKKSAPYYIKLSIIITLFAEIEISDIVKNFLQILLKNNRFHCLHDVISKFNKLILESEGVKMVDLTVVNNDQDFINSIQHDMEKKLNSKVVVNSLEDKSIIAGFIIKIDNMMIDYSFRSKLNKLSKIME